MNQSIFVFLLISFIGFAAGYGVGWIGKRGTMREGTGGVGGPGGTGGPGGNPSGTGGTGGPGGQGGPGSGGRGKPGGTGHVSPDDTEIPGEPGQPGQPGELGSPPSDSRGDARKKWYSDGSTILGVFIVALSVLSVGLFYQATSAQRKQTACQAEQNEEFADAIKIRSSASREGNAALRKLFVTASDPGATDASNKLALAEYLAALDQLDATQTANPLIVGTCQ